MADSRSRSKNRAKSKTKPAHGLAGFFRWFRSAARRTQERPPLAAAAGKTIPAAAAPPPADDSWRATRAELAEILWGEGWNMPLGHDLASVMSKPFSLSKEMSVVDLAAGIGGMARYVAEEYKTYVTGLEADGDLANHGAMLSQRRGMSRTASVAPYLPEIYAPTRKYDCVLIREGLFRLKGRGRFVMALTEGLKNYGQVAWTDYVVEAADIDKPAIAVWREKEKANVLTLAAAQEIWINLGYDLRISEDRTEQYLRGIMMGLLRLVKFIEHRRLSDEVKLLILDEIDLWGRRAAAFKAGMRFYRFYATIKKSN